MNIRSTKGCYVPQYSFGGIDLFCFGQFKVIFGSSISGNSASLPMHFADSEIGSVMAVGCGPIEPGKRFRVISGAVGDLPRLYIAFGST